jgi:hypothetical protein
MKEEQMEHRIVLVEWLDASLEMGPIDLASAKESCGPVTCITVGLVVEETVEVIKLAADYTPNYGQVRAVMSIPQPYVKRLVELAGVDEDGLNVEVLPPTVCNCDHKEDTEEKAEGTRVPVCRSLNCCKSDREGGTS